MKPTFSSDMAVKVFYSHLTTFDVRKRQNKTFMLLEANKIEFESVDIAENDSLKKFLWEKIPPSRNPPKGKDPPPHFFSGESYLGNFDDFNDAKDDEQLWEFLKLKNPIKKQFRYVPYWLQGDKDKQDSDEEVNDEDNSELNKQAESTFQTSSNYQQVDDDEITDNEEANETKEKADDEKPEKDILLDTQEEKNSQSLEVKETERNSEGDDDGKVEKEEESSDSELD